MTTMNISLPEEMKAFIDAQLDREGFYAHEAGVAVADRFLAAAEATFTRLAGQPGLIARFEYGHPAIGALRFLPVGRFRKHLVFYRPFDGGIELVRVLHGARDLDRILADEFGLDDPAAPAGP